MRQLSRPSNVCGVGVGPDGEVVVGAGAGAGAGAGSGLPPQDEISNMLIKSRLANIQSTDIFFIYSS